MKRNLSALLTVCFLCTSSLQATQNSTFREVSEKKDLILKKEVLLGKLQNMDQSTAVSTYASQAGKELQFQEVLVDIVEGSKKVNERDMEKLKAYSNAATILSASGYNFSRGNFDEIKIPGADLSGSNCHDATFRRSDLRQVNFSNCNLDSTLFAKADLTGAFFSEDFVLADHSDGVLSVDISPDGGLIASSGKDNTIRLWSLKQGKLLKVLKGHKDSVGCVSFSKDGKLLASSADKELYLWDIASEKHIKTLSDKLPKATGLKITKKNLLISSHSDLKEVLIWDINSGSKVKSLKGHAKSVIGIDVRGDFLIATGKDKKVYEWNMKTGSMVKIIQIPRRKKEMRKVLNTVAFGPADQVGIAGDDGRVVIWDTKQNKEITSLKKHTAAVYKIQFSPDGKFLASAGKDNTIVLWNLKKQVPLYTFKGHAASVFDIAFSPDGKYLVSASNDSTVRSWKINVTEKSKKGHNSKIVGVKFVKKGSFLFSIDKSENVGFWSAKDGKILNFLRLGNKGDVINGMAISKNSNIFATAHGNLGAKVINKKLRLWDPKGDNTVKLWLKRDNSVELQEVIRGHEAPVWSVQFAHEKPWIVSADVSGNVRVTDLRNFKTKHNLQTGRHVFDVKFSPDDRKIVAACSDGKIFVWDIVSDSADLSILGEKSEDKHLKDVTGVDFFPDGSYLVSCGKDGKAVVWDLRKKVSVFVLRGHTTYLSQCAFSNNGRYVATASIDGEVRIWDFKNERQLQSKRLKQISLLRGHMSPIVGLNFSETFKNYFVTAGADGSIRLWNFLTSETVWVGGQDRVTFVNSDLLDNETLSKDQKSSLGYSFQSILTATKMSSLDYFASDNKKTDNKNKKHSNYIINDQNLLNLLGDDFEERKEDE